MADRRAWHVGELDKAWEKADTISGTNPDLYRQDRSGNVIYAPSYGQNSQMGWVGEHSKPLAAGGTYHPNNVHAYQYDQNAAKGSSYPYNYSSAPMGVTPTAPTVDLRNGLTRTGDLYFKPDGSVDGRSSSVKTGDILITKSGNVDGRSAAVRRGDVQYKSGK